MAVNIATLLSRNKYLLTRTLISRHTEPPEQFGSRRGSPAMAQSLPRVATPSRTVMVTPFGLACACPRTALSVLAVGMLRWRTDALPRTRTGKLYVGKSGFGLVNAHSALCERLRKRRKTAITGPDRAYKKKPLNSTTGGSIAANTKTSTTTSMTKKGTLF